MNQFDEGKIKRHSTGRFAVKERSETQIDLGFLAEPTAEATFGAPKPASPLIDDQMVRDLVAWGESKGRHVASTRRDVEGDELTGEAFTEWINALRAQENKGHKGLTEMGDAKRFITTVMNRSADRQASGTRGHDMKAAKEFKDRVSEHEASTGHKMLPQERDELAEQIRMAYPPGRRPSIGFHNPVRKVSISHTDDDAAAATLNQAERVLLNTPDVVASDFAPGSTADDLLAQVDQGSVRANVSKAMAWGALAEHAGVPGVRSLPLGRARELGRSVTADTISQGLADWQRGEDTPCTEQLFAVFDVRTVDDKDKVADLLGRHRHYAFDLWCSARASSSKPS